MNEQKEDVEDGPTQRLAVVAGSGLQGEKQQAVAIERAVEPRLTKGDLQLNVAPPQAETFAKVGQKRKLESTSSDEGSVASKKPCAVSAQPPSTEQPGSQNSSASLDDCSIYELIKGYQAVPEGSEGIRDFQENDVLCGRGGATNVHPGNIKFRDIINKYRRQYKDGSKASKQEINLAVVASIRKAGGRFLKHFKDEGLWYEVGDTVAREKTSQALRQRTPSDVEKALSEEQVRNNESLREAQEHQRALQEQEDQNRQFEQIQLLQQQQQEQWATLQQQRQEEAMARATAASLGTVTLDLTTANPFAVQQALANPVFRALLAMNKVVIPVNTTQVVNSVPQVVPQAPAAAANPLEALSMPPPPALGTGGFTLPHPDAPANATVVVAPSPAIESSDIIDTRALSAQQPANAATARTGVNGDNYDEMYLAFMGQPPNGSGR